MSNRRQLLLSQLKNNLDIVSRAIGLDKNKATSSAERPAEPARFEPDSSSSIAYSANKDQDFTDVEMRGQAPNRAPPFHADHYPRHAAPNNGTTGVRDDTHEHRSSYDDQYSTHRERTALFPASANDIDSEDAFLYGSRLPEPKSHAQASGYPGNNSRQETGDDLMDKINFLLHGGSTSAKKLPVTSNEMQVDQYSQMDYPQISVAGGAYNEAKRTAYRHSSAASQDSDETVDRILKTIGLDGRITDMVQGLIRKDSQQSARSSQALPQLTVAPPMNASSIQNQMPPVAANSGSNQLNWDRATQQFLNKMSYASMGEMPREPEIPFAFQYPPPPNWNNQKETKLPDSSGGLETRLYFKAKPEGTALPGLSYRQNDSSAGRAMNETLSNIKALEEALAGLNQSKTSLMLRPPGSQRDSMMLENMRMQEELSGQILTLRDTARDLSQQMKNQTSVASSIPPGSATQQSDSLMKDSPTSFASQPAEEPTRESSTSKHSDRVNTDRKSRSRSHSRDRKKHRSRSRSRDRKRTRGSRRHNRSRSRSRDGYRRRTRNRSRSRDRSRSRNRSRSRERRRSRDRMLSDADRKALGFGTSARKALEAKAVVQKAEDKEKKALEMALSMYVGASEYYNGTNIWCQKCDVIFSDVFGLCQHLHSEMHQAKVDPDYNKPRPPYAPVIPPGVPSAPSRGYEFVLPLQAFFCSLCCEFSKDINKAEEHVKSAEHNKKFKQFVTDNSGYELKFLKDVMMAIARAKVAEDPPPPQPTTTDPKPDAGGVADAKKYSGAFLNPEDDSKRETREKFQIKFTGALKQGGSTKVASKLPDVEIVKVTTSEEAKKASGASTSASPNIIVSKMIGMAKKPPEKTEFSRPSGWVLRADAHSKPPLPTYPPKNAAVSPASLTAAKTPLHNDKPRPTLDIFSPDSPKTTSTPFSKSTGGRSQATTTTTPSGTGSAKKSEEAVLNIGDFEIFDEC